MEENQGNKDTENIYGKTESADTGSSFIEEYISVLTTSTGLYESFKTLSSISPVLAGVVGAIGVVAIFDECTNQLADARFADNFGDFTLSLEKLNEVVETIVDGGKLDDIKESLEAFGELEGLNYVIEDSDKRLNRLNWKIWMGYELDEDEKQDYQDDINTLVDSTEDFVVQQQYSASLNLKRLENSPESSEAIAKMKEDYIKQWEKVQELALNLQNVTKDAFVDGIITPEELEAIESVKADLENYKVSIDNNKLTASEVLEQQYGGGDYDTDSYLNISEGLSHELEEAEIQISEDYEITRKHIDKAKKSGVISKGQHEVLEKEAEFVRIQAITEGQISSIDFLYGEIPEEYSTNINRFTPRLEYVVNAKVKYALEEAIDFNNNNGLVLIESDISEYVNNAVSLFDQSDYEKLFDALRPHFESLQASVKQYEELGMPVPEYIQSYLYDIAVIGTLAGDKNATWELVAQTANSAEYADLLSGIQENNIPKVFADAVMGKTYSIDEPTIITPATASELYNIIGVKVEAGSYYPNNSLDEDTTETIVPYSQEYLDSLEEFHLTDELNSIFGDSWSLTPYAMDIQSGNTEPKIQLDYCPTLIFNADAPTKEDVGNSLEESASELEMLLGHLIKEENRAKW